MDNDQKFLSDLQCHFEQQIDDVRDDDFTCSVSHKIDRLQKKRQRIFYALTALLIAGFGVAFWQPISVAMAHYNIPANSPVIMSISVMLMLCCFVAAEE